MEKPLLPAVVSNESESPVSNESLDRTCRHRGLLGRAHVPEELNFSNFVPDRFVNVFEGNDRTVAPAQLLARPKNSARVFVYCLTLTVITLHAPGSVLWRSSPSCSASLCLPGDNWLSNTSLPSPKWTHDGVPFTMFLPAGRQSWSMPTW